MSWPAAAAWAGKSGCPYSTQNGLDRERRVFSVCVCMCDLECVTLSEWPWVSECCQGGTALQGLRGLALLLLLSIYQYLPRYVRLFGSVGRWASFCRDRSCSVTCYRVTCSDKRGTKSPGRPRGGNWRKHHLGVIWSMYCFGFLFFYFFIVGHASIPSYSYCQQPVLTWHWLLNAFQMTKLLLWLTQCADTFSSIFSKQPLKRMRLTSQWRSASLGTETEVPGVGGNGSYLITVELPLLSPEW